MIQFYIAVFVATFFSLPFLPYLTAQAWVTYRNMPAHRIHDSGWKLAFALGWGMWTVIFVILMLWSALGIKDSIFSHLGYLC